MNPSSEQSRIGLLFFVFLVLSFPLLCLIRLWGRVVNC